MSTGTGGDAGRLAPAAERRRAALVAGHTGDLATARRGLDDDDHEVRAAAVGALGRLGALDERAVRAAADDAHPAVRRRTAEVLAMRPELVDPATATILVELLADPDELVAEAAAFALGEHLGAAPDDDPRPAPVPVLGALVEMAGTHDDAGCREAAVAALGAIGDATALPALVAATGDRPAIRRRAAIALAAFVDLPEAVTALGALLDDRDWQTREIAQALLDEPPG